MIETDPTDALIQIEAIYCTPHDEWSARFEIASDTTIEQFLPQLSNTPVGHLDLSIHALGVWGQRVGSHHVLQHGDRLEFYRPLQADAKTARRRRAEEQKQTRNS